MDLFPIALTNRDMSTLMGLIEEYGPEVRMPNIPGVEDPDDIDEVKRAVSQMGSREMSKFLDKFVEGMGEPLQYVSLRSSPYPPSQESIEEIRSLRESLGVLRGIRSRIRRPR